MEHEENDHPNVAHADVFDVDTGKQSNHNFNYDGFWYNRKKVNKSHTTYWCKYQRTEKCPAKLKLYDNNRTELYGDNHCASCKMRNGFQIIQDPDELLNHNVRSEMKKMAEIMALENLSMRPQEVWERVSAEIKKKCVVDGTG